MTERAVVSVEPFIIPGHTKKVFERRMKYIVWREDGNYYQATVLFKGKRNNNSGIVGQQILARNPEALRDMLIDMGKIYPPLRDMKIYPHEARCQIVREPWNKKQ